MSEKSRVRATGKLPDNTRMDKPVTKKVPVSIRLGGVRQVIGEAVVEIDGEYISVDAKVNMEFAPYLADDYQHFSLGPLVMPKKNGRGNL